MLGPILPSLAHAVLFLIAVTSSPFLSEAEVLPNWVQNHREATLWSGPDARAIGLGQVAPWGGFQVHGAQGERLQVLYLGNGVDLGPGMGWVDRADVGPTNRPLLWIAAGERAPLWSGPDGDATLFGHAPPGTLMVRLESSVNGRAQVYSVGDANGTGAGLAWVEVSAVRPSLSPASDSPLWRIWGEWEARVEAEARTAAGSPSAVAAPSAPLSPPVAALSAEERERFIQRIGEATRRWRQEIGLPVSLVTAMAINESGWGQSQLARVAHNLFGIKAHRGAGTAGAMDFPTWEVIDGKAVPIVDSFRAYYTDEESVRDLGRFLHSNSRYSALWTAGQDPATLARLLGQAGYATDPAWPDKLIGLIDRYNLRRLDQ